MIACGMGNLDLVNTLIDHGADINARSPGGYTALMSAALNGQLAVVERLLEKGVDVNQKDVSGRAAIDYAKAQKRSDVVKLLTKAQTRK
jgi:ankyrin repeat protein